MLGCIINGKRSFLQAVEVQSLSYINIYGSGQIAQKGARKFLRRKHGQFMLQKVFFMKKDFENV